MFKSNQSQITGRSGERWFQFILPTDWIFQPPREDFGIDGKVVIVSEDRNISGLDFEVQIKSSQKFDQKNGFIILKNINSDRFKYWGSSLDPFMIVAFDEKNNKGYYVWLQDAFTSDVIRNIVHSKQKSLTIKIPIQNILDNETFKKITGDVYKSVLLKVTSMAKLSSLTVLNRMSRGLCLLQYQLFLNPQNDTETKAMDLEILLGHTTIVEGLENFINYLQIGPVVGADPTKYLNFLGKVKKFRENYIKDVEGFIKNFSASLNNKNTSAFWIDIEKSRSMTPVLCAQVLSFIYDTTDIGILAMNMGLPISRSGD